MSHHLIKKKYSRNFLETQPYLEFWLIRIPNVLLFNVAIIAIDIPIRDNNSRRE